MQLAIQTKATASEAKNKQVHICPYEHVLFKAVTAKNYQEQLPVLQGVNYDLSRKYVCGYHEASLPR